MSLKTILATSLLLAASQLVAGHGAIIKAVGDKGGVGSAIGVDPNTPRDGTRRQPFQQDSTRFKGEAKDTVGETLGGGTNDLESGTAAVMANMGNTLPQVSPGGPLTMTLHQVNADGAGPYKCMINADGTAQSWENIQVTQNVDGNARGRNNAGSKSDHALVAQVPQNQQCQGNIAGQQNVCLVRCQNPARAGPFGGVVPIQVNPNGGASPPASAAPPAATTPAAGGAGKAGNAGNAGKGNKNNQNEGKRAVEFSA